MTARWLRPATFSPNTCRIASRCTGCFGENRARSGTRPRNGGLIYSSPNSIPTWRDGSGRACARTQGRQSWGFDNVILQKSFHFLPPERKESHARFAHRDPASVKPALDLPFVIHAPATQHLEATGARQTEHEKVKCGRGIGEFLMPFLEADGVTARSLPKPHSETVAGLRRNLQVMHAGLVRTVRIILEGFLEA